MESARSVVLADFSNMSFMQAAQPKPFGCNKCGKIFARKDTLQRHSKIHSGLYYICVECGSKFVQEGQLQNHLITVHGPDDIILYCQILASFVAFQYSLIVNQLLS